MSSASLKNSLRRSKPSFHLERLIGFAEERSGENKTCVVGLDGFKGGWIAVWIDGDGSRGFELIEHVSFIIQYRLRLALIDIPIGLNNAYRACDLAAREMLGPCRNRVFLGARRFLLQPELIDDFERANRLAKSKYGKGVSRQLFALLPKIKQVDDLLADLPDMPLRETHP